jgi:hypothetical protein
MPVKKSQSSAKTKSRKAPRASAGSRARGGPLPPYGVAIQNAIASGDVREMRKVAAATRKWLGEVKTSLAAMEKSVKDLEG